MPGRRGKEPAGRERRPRAGRGGARDNLDDLVQLIIAYARQEALDPVLVRLRTLLWGLVGAFLAALGTVFIAVGFLRALQSEFGGAGRGNVAAVLAGHGATGLARQVLVYAPYGTGAHLSGDWSWVPYMGGSLLALCVVVACVVMFRRGGLAR